MSTNREETEKRLVTEQAAQWLCDLRETDEAQEQKLLTWLKQSPRHIREFLFAETVWREVRQARFKDLDLDALITEARADESQGNIVPLPSQLGALTPAARRRQPMALAAGIALVAIGVTLASWWVLQKPVYSTQLGEQRSLQLDDGSWMHLNTHSRVEVRYSAHTRELRLTQGEALFTVQPDSARPFIVHAGNAVIRALGTQFNVYRQAESTTVAVISGAVQVTAANTLVAPSAGPIRLDAGQEAQLAASGQVLRTQPDVVNAVAWRERRLVFRGTPLETVAAEFNRYNQRQIRVEGASARRKLLSGTFNADDPDSLVLFLQKLTDLSVASGSGGLEIRSLPLEGSRDR